MPGIIPLKGNTLAALNGIVPVLSNAYSAIGVYAPATVGGGHDLLTGFCPGNGGVATSGGLITSVPNLVSGGAPFLPGSTAPALTLYNNVPVIDCSATGNECLTTMLAMPTGVSRQTVYLAVYIMSYVPGAGAMLWSRNNTPGLYWYLSNDNNGYVQGAGSDVMLTDYSAIRAAGKFAVLTFYTAGGTTKIRVNGVVQPGTGGAAAAIPAGLLNYLVNTYVSPGFNGKTKTAAGLVYAAPTDPTNAQMAQVEAAIRAYVPT